MNLLPSIVVSALVTAAVATVAPRAVAAEPGHHARSSGPSAGLVEEARRWLTAATSGPAALGEATTGSPTSTTAERAEAATASPAAEHKPFIDLSPSVSLVARDWRGSMKLAGPTMLVDDLRPTASNRMVVGRIATDARLATFAQLGIGEWRIDTAMFPSARSYSEIAGQLGAGIELRLPRNLRFAGECEYTMLYRDLRYAAGEVAPRILAFVVAMDGRF
jgi:hypothetical protein